jgi:cation:H+ antiporter
MSGAVLLVVVGAVVATVGARATALGVAAAAGRRGVPAATLGAAFLGLAVEGVLIVLVAASRGDGAVVIGASLGTPVFLLAAGLGAGLLLARRPVRAPAPAVVLVPAATLLATALAAADQVLSRFDGVALVAVFAASVGVVVREAGAARALGERRYREAGVGAASAAGPGAASAVGPGVASAVGTRTTGPGATGAVEPRAPGAGRLGAPGPRIVVGLALAVAGALALVAGVDRIAARISPAPGFLAAAVAGGGAGLGRGLLDVLPGMGRDPTTTVADLLASLAVLGTGALGLATLIRPMMVDSAALSALLAAGAMYAAVAVPLLARGRIGRVTGAVVLALYGIWLGLGARI